jgi:hypothetical protein
MLHIPNSGFTDLRILQVCINSKSIALHYLVRPDQDPQDFFFLLREIDLKIFRRGKSSLLGYNGFTEQAIRSALLLLNGNEHHWARGSELKAFKLQSLLTRRAPRSALVSSKLLLLLFRYFGQDLFAIIFESIFLSIDAERRLLRNSLLHFHTAIANANSALTYKPIDSPSTPSIPSMTPQSTQISNQSDPALTPAECNQLMTSMLQSTNISQFWTPRLSLEEITDLDGLIFQPPQLPQPPHHRHRITALVQGNSSLNGEEICQDIIKKVAKSTQKGMDNIDGCSLGSSHVIEMGDEDSNGNFSAENCNNMFSLNKNSQNIISHLQIPLHRIPALESITIIDDDCDDICGNGNGEGFDGENCDQNTNKNTNKNKKIISVQNIANNSASDDQSTIYIPPKRAAYSSTIQTLHGDLIDLNITFDTRKNNQSNQSNQNNLSQDESEKNEKNEKKEGNFDLNLDELFNDTNNASYQGLNPYKSFMSSSMNISYNKRFPVFSPLYPEYTQLFNHTSSIQPNFEQNSPPNCQLLSTQSSDSFSEPNELLHSQYNITPVISQFKKPHNNSESKPSLNPNFEQNLQNSKNNPNFSKISPTEIFNFELSSFIPLLEDSHHHQLPVNIDTDLSTTKLNDGKMLKGYSNQLNIFLPQQEISKLYSSMLNSNPNFNSPPRQSTHSIPTTAPRYDSPSSQLLPPIQNTNSNHIPLSHPHQLAYTTRTKVVLPTLFFPTNTNSTALHGNTTPIALSGPFFPYRPTQYSFSVLLSSLMQPRASIRRNIRCIGNDYPKLFLEAEPIFLPKQLNQDNIESNNSHNNAQSSLTKFGHANSWASDGISVKDAQDGKTLLFQTNGTPTHFPFPAEHDYGLDSTPNDLFLSQRNNSNFGNQNNDSHNNDSQNPQSDLYNYFISYYYHYPKSILHHAIPNTNVNTDNSHYQSKLYTKLQLLQLLGAQIEPQNFAQTNTSPQNVTQFHSLSWQSTTHIPHGYYNHLKYPQTTSFPSPPFPQVDPQHRHQPRFPSSSTSTSPPSSSHTSPLLSPSSFQTQPASSLTNYPFVISSKSIQTDEFIIYSNIIDEVGLEEQGEQSSFRDLLAEKHDMLDSLPELTSRSAYRAKAHLKLLECRAREPSMSDLEPFREQIYCQGCFNYNNHNNHNNNNNTLHNQSSSLSQPSYHHLDNTCQTSPQTDGITNDNLYRYDLDDLTKVDLSPFLPPYHQRLTSHHIAYKKSCMCSCHYQHYLDNQYTIAHLDYRNSMRIYQEKLSFPLTTNSINSRRLPSPVTPLPPQEPINPRDPAYKDPTQQTALTSMFGTVQFGMIFLLTLHYFIFRLKVAGVTILDPNMTVLPEYSDPFQSNGIGIDGNGGDISDDEIGEEDGGGGGGSGKVKKGKGKIDKKIDKSDKSEQYERNKSENNITNNKSTTSALAQDNPQSSPLILPARRVLQSTLTALKLNKKEDEEKMKKLLTESDINSRNSLLVPGSKVTSFSSLYPLCHSFPAPTFLPGVQLPLFYTLDPENQHPNANDPLSDALLLSCRNATFFHPFKLNRFNLQFQKNSEKKFISQFENNHDNDNNVQINPTNNHFENNDIIDEFITDNTVDVSKQAKSDPKKHTKCVTKQNNKHPSSSSSSSSSLSSSLPVSPSPPPSPTNSTTQPSPSITSTNIDPQCAPKYLHPYQVLISAVQFLFSSMTTPVSYIDTPIVHEPALLQSLYQPNEHPDLLIHLGLSEDPIDAEEYEFEQKREDNKVLEKKLFNQIDGERKKITQNEFDNLKKIEFDLLAPILTNSTSQRQFFFEYKAISDLPRGVLPQYLLPEGFTMGTFIFANQLKKIYQKLNILDLIFPSQNSDNNFPQIPPSCSPITSQSPNSAQFPPIEFNYDKILTKTLQYHDKIQKSIQNVHNFTTCENSYRFVSLCQPNRLTIKPHQTAQYLVSHKLTNTSFPYCINSNNFILWLKFSKQLATLPDQILVLLYRTSGLISQLAPDPTAHSIIDERSKLEMQYGIACEASVGALTALSKKTRQLLSSTQQLYRYQQLQYSLYHKHQYDSLYTAAVSAMRFKGMKEQGLNSNDDNTNENNDSKHDDQKNDQNDTTNNNPHCTTPHSPTLTILRYLNGLLDNLAQSGELTMESFVQERGKKTTKINIGGKKMDIPITAGKRSNRPLSGTRSVRTTEDYESSPGAFGLTHGGEGDGRVRSSGKGVKSDKTVVVEKLRANNNNLINNVNIKPAKEPKPPTRILSSRARNYANYVLGDDEGPEPNTVPSNTKRQREKAGLETNSDPQNLQNLHNIHNVHNVHNFPKNNSKTTPKINSKKPIDLGQYQELLASYSSSGQNTPQICTVGSPNVQYYQNYDLNNIGSNNNNNIHINGQNNDFFQNVNLNGYQFNNNPVINQNILFNSSEFAQNQQIGTLFGQNGPNGQIDFGSNLLHAQFFSQNTNKKSQTSPTGASLTPPSGTMQQIPQSLLNHNHFQIGQHHYQIANNNIQQNNQQNNSPPNSLQNSRQNTDNTSQLSPPNHYDPATGKPHILRHKGNQPTINNHHDQQFVQLLPLPTHPQNHFTPPLPLQSHLHQPQQQQQQPQQQPQPHQGNPNKLNYYAHNGAVTPINNNQYASLLTQTQQNNKPFAQLNTHSIQTPNKEQNVAKLNENFPIDQSSTKLNTNIQNVNFNLGLTNTQQNRPYQTLNNATMFSNQPQQIPQFVWNNVGTHGNHNGLNLCQNLPNNIPQNLKPNLNQNFGSNIGPNQAIFLTNNFNKVNNNPLLPQQTNTGQNSQQAIYSHHQIGAVHTNEQNNSRK